MMSNADVWVAVVGLVLIGVVIFMLEVQLARRKK